MSGRRRSDTHLLVRWLWTSRRLDARLMRLILLPASLLYGLVMLARSWSYARGWREVHDLQLPTIAVGNLTVGGSGKTPIAGWIAARFAARGLRPGILLRGVGGDEVLVHREAVPEAVVVANPDRAAGAALAHGSGAQVLILDDAFQRQSVLRDLNICVVSVESMRAVGWSLPAGPWREQWRALDRADAVVITRKRADRAAADLVAERVRRVVKGPVAMARLDLVELVGLVSGRRYPIGALEGRRVVVACAIADPAAFVSQVKRTGAQVQVATWKDHHQYRDEDLAWLAHAARRADHLVVTAKDAVKLRDRWPASVPEPLVAELSVTFEAGEEELGAAIDAVLDWKS